MCLVLFIRHEGDKVNEVEMGNHVKLMEDMGNVWGISWKT